MQFHNINVMIVTISTSSLSVHLKSNNSYSDYFIQQNLHTPCTGSCLSHTSTYSILRQLIITLHTHRHGAPKYCSKMNPYLKRKHTPKHKLSPQTIQTGRRIRGIFITLHPRAVAILRDVSRRSGNIIIRASFIELDTNKFIRKTDQTNIQMSMKIS